MSKYTIEQLEAALEQLENQSDDLCVLCRKLIKEKLALLRAGGRPKSDKSLKERRNEYQRKWRERRKSLLNKQK